MSLILKRRFAPEFSSKSRTKSVKTPLPVDVRGSKTSLLQLSNIWLSSAANVVHQPTKKGDVGQSDTTSDEITNRSFLQTKQTDLTYNDHLLTMTVQL